MRGWRFTLGVIVLALAGSVVSAGDDAQPSTPQAAIRGLHEALRSGDVERVLDCMGTDVGPLGGAARKASRALAVTWVQALSGRPYWKIGERVAGADAASGVQAYVHPLGRALPWVFTLKEAAGLWYVTAGEEITAERYAAHDVPRIQRAAVPGPGSADAAADEIVLAIRKGVSLSDLWDGWSVWASWGLSATDPTVAFDLPALLRAARAEPDHVELIAAPAEGQARHALRFAVAGGRIWRLLLVRERRPVPGEFAWKLAAVTVQEGPVITAEAVTVSAGVLQQVLAAVDGADAKAFAALSVNLSRPGGGALAEADVLALLQELHVKYGARPRKLGPAMAFRSHEKDGVTIPVIFGDAEDLLLFSIVEGRLAQVSVGDPASWPAETEAGPGK